MVFIREDGYFQDSLAGDVGRCSISSRFTKHELQWLIICIGPYGEELIKAESDI